MTEIAAIVAFVLVFLAREVTAMRRERALEKALAEAQRMLASEGYRAFAQGKQIERKAETPPRELSEKEMRDLAERAAFDNASETPYSVA